MKGYSCTRDDWQWIVRTLADNVKHIDGVIFDDGHQIYFKDMPPAQVNAYLKAGGLKRGADGKLSVAKGNN